MAGRFFKFATTAAIGGYTGYVLHQNDWNPRHIGLVRFGYAALTVGQIAVDYKYSVSHLRDDSEESLKKWHECHQRAARHLLRLCSTNGGVFIKVGQHIAALDYLVPKPYIDTLKILHNQAPRSSFPEVCAVIRKETGFHVQDIFDEFDPEPIASASLAQVYRAKLKDSGEIVAVKVQHPKVFQHSLVDMATMEFLCSIVKRIFPEFSFSWLVEETKRNLPLELDFVNEAKNATNISAILKDIEWLKIPHIYWKYTTRRLLTMEFVDGKIITDKDHIVANRINPQEIVNRFEQLYGKMICTYGTVHCDPHPGNVLIKTNTDDGQKFHLYLLDHGLYTQLTDEFRYNYCAMWLAIFRGDLVEIKRTAKELGIDEKNAAMLSCMVSAKPWSAIVRGLENRPTTADAVQKEKLEMRRNASRFMNQITEVLATVDRQMLLVLKTNDLIRYISHVLGCDERRSLLNMNRYCIEVCQQKKYRQAKGLLQKTKVVFETQFLYWRLSLYRFVLWINSWFHQKQLAS